MFDTATASVRASARRVTSLDVLRGIVMVLMAIDHVRVYSGIPAGGPTAGVFFTRWVTHFCAPVFVFFAGTSAFLSGQKSGDIRALSRRLLTRGLVLVLLELTVIRFFWSFSLPTPGFVLLGVIWMLGWCMVLMSALVHLPIRALAAFGLVTIFLQDILGAVGGLVPPSAQWILQVLYFGGELTPGGANIQVLYSIVPWIGVMAVGYAFGAIAVRERERQHRLYWRIGLAATVVFLVVGGLATFAGGDADGPPALVRLLNQRKYPASQLFLLMTLGPSIAFLPFADRVRGSIMKMFETFGRVPMFYYLLHIPVIHLLALLVWYVRDGSVHAEWFTTAPYVAIPPDERWGLPLMYLVFVTAVAALYVPCRWFAEEKARRPRAWMRFM